jgi:hypothetical protein
VKISVIGANSGVGTILLRDLTSCAGGLAGAAVAGAITPILPALIPFAFASVLRLAASVLGYMLAASTVVSIIDRATTPFRSRCQFRGNRDQFMLGHVSIQTRSAISDASRSSGIAVNDRLGTEPDPA